MGITWGDAEAKVKDRAGSRNLLATLWSSRSEVKKISKISLRPDQETMACTNAINAYRKLNTSERSPRQNQTLVLLNNAQHTQNSSNIPIRTLWLLGIFLSALCILNSSLVILRTLNMTIDIAIHTTAYVLYIASYIDICIREVNILK